MSQLSVSGRYVTDATHRFLLLLKSMSSKLGLAIGLGLARGCGIAGQYEQHVGKNKGQRLSLCPIFSLSTDCASHIN